MCDWEIDKDLENISERFYKIKQENQVLKTTLRKVLNSIRSLHAQCNVATEEIDQYRPAFDVDAAIRDKLVDKISSAIIEHFDEVCSVEVRPSLKDYTTTYSAKLNLVKIAELEQLVKLLNENEE